MEVGLNLKDGFLIIAGPGELDLQIEATAITDEDFEVSFNQWYQQINEATLYTR